MRAASFTFWSMMAFGVLASLRAKAMFSRTVMCG